VCGIWQWRHHSCLLSPGAFFGVSFLICAGRASASVDGRMLPMRPAPTPRLPRRLLSRFHGLTGCPVLVNTSFNVRSEPIVCTPEDAFRCFMGTDLDLLVVGNSVLRKEAQDPKHKIVYKDASAAARRIKTTRFAAE